MSKSFRFSGGTIFCWWVNRKVIGNGVKAEDGCRCKPGVEDSGYRDNSRVPPPRKIFPPSNFTPRRSRQLARLCSPKLTQDPPAGGDDNGLAANGLAAVPPRPEWVTLYLSASGSIVESAEASLRSGERPPRERGNADAILGCD